MTLYLWHGPAANVGTSKQADAIFSSTPDTSKHQTHVPGSLYDDGSGKCSIVSASSGRPDQEQ
jgi:hypothetical protein